MNVMQTDKGICKPENGFGRRYYHHHHHLLLLLLSLCGVHLQCVPADSNLDAKMIQKWNAIRLGADMLCEGDVFLKAKPQQNTKKYLCEWNIFLQMFFLLIRGFFPQLKISIFVRFIH